MVYPLLLLAASLLITSCFRPKEVLSRKKMERLMYDVYIAEATIENDYQGLTRPRKKRLISIGFSSNTTYRKRDGTPHWHGIPTELIFT